MPAPAVNVMRPESSDTVAAAAGPAPARTAPITTIGTKLERQRAIWPTLTRSGGPMPVFGVDRDSLRPRGHPGSAASGGGQRRLSFARDGGPIRRHGLALKFAGEVAPITGASVAVSRKRLTW